jgi:hypothetical protein
MIDPGKPKLVDFGDLLPGDKFVTFPNDGSAHLWIKTHNKYVPDNLAEHELWNIGDRYDNAVSIQDGFPVSFNKTDM